MKLAAKKLYRWSEWQEPFEPVVRYAVEVLGLTEVDVRDWRRAVSHDVYQIRAKNWRKFTITGLELVYAMQLRRITFHTGMPAAHQTTWNGTRWWMTWRIYNGVA